MDLIDELQSRVLCGDGAMGTSLMELADAPIDRCLEEFCLSAPDLVAKIHRQYLDAGARVIEANSFGSNAARLARHGLESCTRELNTAAVRLAQRAAAGRDGVYIAGSVGPLGLTADEARERGIDRRDAYKEQIGAQLDAGVDLIFFETFLDLDEILLALEVQRGLTAATPALCSLACSEEGRLPGGATITEAFTKLREAGAAIVGVNCLNGPHATLKLLEHVPLAPGQLLSAYPNAGYPKYHEGRFLYYTAPEYFAKVAKEMAGQGACLVGGCCGTGPSQVAAMAAALRDLAPVTSKVFVRPIEPPPGAFPALTAAEEAADAAGKTHHPPARALAPPPAPPVRPVRVLILPVKTGADETAGAMLAHVLALADIGAEAVSSKMLVNEILADIDARHIGMVCISAVRPFAVMHARFLAKRLRVRFPQIKVMIGLWDSKKKAASAERKPEDSSADWIVSTLAEAVHEVRQSAPCLPALTATAVEADEATAQQRGKPHDLVSV